MRAAHLILSIQKNTYLQGAFADGALAGLTPLSGQRGKRERLGIPIGPGEGRKVKVQPGEWLVEARLPSGEVLSTEVNVEPGETKPVPLAARATSNETWSMPTTFSRRARAVYFNTLDTGASVMQDLQHDTAEVELARWDPQHEDLRNTDDWELVGSPGPANLEFVTSNCRLPQGDRTFVAYRDSGCAVSLPLPWGFTDDTVIQIKALPDKAAPDGWTLRAWVFDQDVGGVFAFLDASDLDAARSLSPKLAPWAEKLLESKMANPVAAAAGALALIRLRQYKLLHHWPLNLADWFHWLPDGAIIAAWCALRLGMGRESVRGLSRSRRLEEGTRHLHDACRRGVPYFAPSAALLHDVCDLLVQADKASLDPKLIEWVERLYQSVRPGALVATYETASRTDLVTLLRGPYGMHTGQLAGAVPFAHS